MIEADSGILQDTSDPKLLFKYFARQYSTHDAEDGFPWAAKWIKFGVMNPLSSRIAPGAYWIKSMFVATCMPVFILI